MREVDFGGGGWGFAIQLGNVILIILGLVGLFN